MNCYNTRGIQFCNLTIRNWILGDLSWVFIGGTDAEGETPILWSPDAKN